MRSSPLGRRCHTYKPLSLPLPLPRSIHTPLFARDKPHTTHQITHRVCIDDSKLSLVGIVPDRELVLRYLMET